MANLSKTTEDHEEIRRWAEERGAEPACVKGTGDEGDIGMLRLDFPGYSGEESLQHITWDEFFQKFDERKLALVYQEETAGGERSNFNKLVSAQTAQASRSGGHRRRGSSAGQAAKGAVKTKGAANGSAAKSSAKKAPAKKSAAKKSPAKKAPAKKKAAVKKSAQKKSSSARRPAKKSAPKKTVAKKSAAKKSAAKSALRRRR
ncbi:MAG TPA: hypothetical protein VFA65_09085 [Bryobacteraceae bacterium]|nr:hypothetical protein [Bryobacteraceae bacterium]